MNLYYIQGSCALAPHIVAIEAGIPVQTIEVDFPTKTVVPSGADYLSVNPKGYVPALELDDGEVLTEAPVVVQYLADMKPEAKLAPANGTLARRRRSTISQPRSTRVTGRCSIRRRRPKSARSAPHSCASAMPCWTSSWRGAPLSVRAAALAAGSPQPSPRPAPR